MGKVALLILTGCILLYAAPAPGQEQMIDGGWYHVRNAEPREWSDFPAKAEKKKLVLQFGANANTTEQALCLRQYDVKLDWKVTLNGHSLGSLVSDEKDLICYLPVPPGMLKSENTLEISCNAAQADDIRVGNVVLHPRPVHSVLSDGFLDVEVAEDGTAALIPARLTITNGEGTLQSAIAAPGNSLAVRPGFIYTGNGRASIGLAEGTYKVYAGRGFEYGLDSAEVVIKKGERKRQKFSIKREVSTDGWVSSDTHIHTFTWSRHGDATSEERVLTIAGEGLELPIFTEHNLQVDMKAVARGQGVGDYFTAVTGNEVTTAVGHFNVFPLAAETTVIDHQGKNWETLSEILDPAKTKAIILNHARDIHAKFRPFDPTIHLASAGARLDGWELPANAMEVINSGAQQTDRMELIRDWFGMLNHGHFLTPAGASDSHDVSRFIVGQARTYIRCNDDDVSALDVQEAVRNFREGNVMVSFGLLTEIEVDDMYGPGELVTTSDEVKVSVKVSGPAWMTADRVALYANGKKIREETITDRRKAGIKWSGTWKLDAPTHDIYLVAIAEGPDELRPYWPIARPYQPTSADWQGGVFGLSGAVWLDVDRNGKRTSAHDYARELVDQFPAPAALMQKLAAYDEAVAMQVAAILHRKGKDLKGPEMSKALRRASPETRSGFAAVIRELGLRK